MPRPSSWAVCAGARLLMHVCGPGDADGLKGTLVTFPLLLWVFGGAWLVLGMLGLIAVKGVLDFGEFGAVDHVHTPGGLASLDEAFSDPDAPAPAQGGRQDGSEDELEFSTSLRHADRLV